MGKKNLDEELAEVAGLDEDANDAPNSKGDGEDDGMSVPARAADDPRRGKRNLGLLATLLVMVVGIVALFMFGFKEAAIYSMPVDKFVARKAEMIDRRVRIEGELVPGTLKKRDKPCEYRFLVQAGGEKLPVRYPQCIIPDTFRDMPQGGVMVTAEGALTQAGHFEATLIMAKCSSKYDPETHTMEAGEQARAEP